jgi:Skp family chaperone for outer membrane proteins
MKKTLALAFVLMPTLALAASAPPQPRIVVIDRAAILKFSKVGQDIARQVQDYANQAKRDLSSQGRALEKEGQELQQQVAILAPDLKQKKIAAFEARQASLQGAAQKKDDQIRGGLIAARSAVEKVLGPILEGIVHEHGANMVLDKQAVVYASSPAFDITGEAIEKLNAKMSAYHVTMQAPPAPSSAVARN